MSDTPEMAPESPVEAQTDTPEGNDTGEAPRANREARYRVERNEARDERDALAQRVEQLQNRELERIASRALSNPADLLTLSGKTLADFLDEDGELDVELITDTANDLLGTRPGLRPLPRAVDHSQGRGSTGATVADWSSLLNS